MEGEHKVKQRRALKVTLVAAAIGIGLAVGRRLVWPTPPPEGPQRPGG